MSFNRWNKMIEDYKASRTHEAGNDPARREPDTLPENDRDQEQRQFWKLPAIKSRCRNRQKTGAGVPVPAHTRKKMFSHSPPSPFRPKNSLKTFDGAGSLCKNILSRGRSP